MLFAHNLYSLSPLVVGRVRETYETFPGGSLHTFSPERKYGVLFNPPVSFADSPLRRAPALALTVHRTVIHYHGDASLTL